EAKYYSENWIDEGKLAMEFPTIRDSVFCLGLGFMFSKLSKCNLTLVREFYANWNATHGSSTRVDVKGQEMKTITETPLTQAKHQDRDDRWRVSTFGMFDLQLWIGGPTFTEPFYDDEPTVLTNEVDDEDDIIKSTVMVGNTNNIVSWNSFPNDDDDA
ncbi:hypothetical protein HAX54_023166, partial [Datura stramonium]|nr:hypothetical protein [Datura stramonium]